MVIEKDRIRIEVSLLLFRHDSHDFILGFFSDQTNRIIAIIGVIVRVVRNGYLILKIHLRAFLVLRTAALDSPYPVSPSLSMGEKKYFLVTVDKNDMANFGPNRRWWGVEFDFK